MKKNLLIVGLIVGGVVVLVGLMNAKNRAAAVAPAKKPLPVLLELKSPDCEACKAMAPVIDEVQNAYVGRLEVEIVDVQKEREAAELYGIQAVPTLVFFDADGNELFRHTGFFSREEIVAKLKEFGVAPPAETRKRE